MPKIIIIYNFLKKNYYKLELPAILSASIVVSTSGYNLSSIAVAPINSKSVSISLYNNCIYSTLFSMSVLAILYFYSHCWYIDYLISFWVNNRVRSPISP